MRLSAALLAAGVVMTSAPVPALKSFTLHATSTHNKVLIHVPLPTRLRGRTITVKVTSHNKPVIVDALVARLT